MRIIIDEKVSETSFLFQSFLKWLGNQPVEFIFLSKHCPDRVMDEILGKLLPKYQNILTKDKELHNNALSKGFSSFTLDEKGAFTLEPLKNIRPKKTPSPNVEKSVEVQSEPSAEVNQMIHSLMDTLSEVNRERMRMKKRRIYNYFEDPSHMESVSFTIASEEILEKVLGGYFLKVIAKKPFKSLQLASEGYSLDSVEENLLSPVFHALSHLYCLQLAHLPAVLHIVSPKTLEICKMLKETSEPALSRMEEGIRLLLKHLPKVEVLPCINGAFFERMQSKLYQMKHGNTNEVVALDFEVIAECLFEPAAF